MLCLLHIENIALIEEADIHFHGGFNVLTGETGAGKSIVVDSISAVLGERTSRDLIRTGSKSALVQAVFSQEEPPKVLSDMGIEVEDELVLRREIRPDGKNICRANGTILSVAQLKELGRHLLHIHGQHDGQQLLDPLSHLGYLDSFGKTASALEEFQEVYASLGEIRREISKLQLSEGERERKIDMLSFQIKELGRAELSLEEDTALEERRELLRSAGKTMEALESTQGALFGNEDVTGAISLLESASESLRTLRNTSPQMAELAEKLSEISSQAEDVGEILRETSRELEVTPEELDEMEARLDLLYRLKKKYGDTVEEMIAYQELCEKELETIADSDDRMILLEKKLGTQLKLAQKKGEILGKIRRDVGKSLTKRVVEELRQLDMPKVQFSVEFSPKTCQFAMDETGLDNVQFLMSANVGEDLKPIQKVASGGELARIMLAMKNVLAQDDGIASLVFDEVDAGVSGRAAQKVAEKMAEVARHKQVLCVTHLPQIAAMADAHLQVEKGEVKGRTFTAVQQLGREGRREELARLIGGTAMTDAILTSAEELLSQAEKFKE
ncbi:MAG: DNA repair protein RecN [Eubacteriales bacterium]